MNAHYGFTEQADTPEQTENNELNEEIVWKGGECVLIEAMILSIIAALIYPLRILFKDS